MSEKLKIWLEDKERTKEVGIELLRALHTNQRLVRFLSLLNSPDVLDTIFEELKSIAKRLGVAWQNPTKVVVKRLAQMAVVLPANEPNKSFEVFAQPIERKTVSSYKPTSSKFPDNEESIALKQKHAHLFNRKEILRKSLGDFGTSNEAHIVANRKQVIDEIKNLKAQIAEVKSKINFFGRYGFCQTEEKIVTNDDLKKRLRNVRARISQLRKEIDETQDEGRRNMLDKRLKGLEQEKEELIKKIK